MTQDAQSALRRIMELYSASTRFCLICNYVSRIIEPVASRCSKFRFMSIGESDCRQRLLHIIEREGLTYEPSALDMLLTLGDGDLRKSITYLQSCHNIVRGGNASASTDQLDLSGDVLADVAGVVPDTEIDKVWTACTAEDSKNRYANIRAVTQDLYFNGYNAETVLSQIHDRLIADERLDQRQIIMIIERLAVTDKCLFDGADEFLQLLDIFLFISDTINHRS